MKKEKWAEMKKYAKYYKLWKEFVVHPNWYDEIR